jgi:hypothetical protein
MVFLNEFHGFLTVVSFSDYFDIVCLLQELSDASPHHGMVVC